MLDLNQLAAFAAVIEEGGFERAGQVLHITQSAVTQRVRQLEETVGQVLLIREQPPSTTAAGLKILEYYRKISLLENELEFPAKTGETRSQTIPLAINADSLATWFTKVLLRHMEQSDAFLDIRSADQDLTHTLLSGGEVMGCVSAFPRAVQGCRIRPLGRMQYRFACTDSYWRRHFPKGITREALEGAPKMNFNKDDKLLDSWLDKAFPGTGRFGRSHFVPSSDLFPILIRGGRVSGMLPEEQYQELKENWELTDLSLDHPVSIDLYWHRWALESAVLNSLEDMILEEAAAALLNN